MSSIDNNTCQLYNNDKYNCHKGGIFAIKNKLAEFRKEKNINQTDLGKRIGVSRQTISLIERGDYNPSVMVALSLAKVFSVNVEDIFSLEDDYEKAL